MEQETTAGKLEITAIAPEAPSKIFDDDGLVTYYTSCLLATCMAKGIILIWKLLTIFLVGGFQVSGFIQYFNYLVGVAIGYHYCSNYKHDRMEDQGKFNRQNSMDYFNIAMELSRVCQENKRPLSIEKLNKGGQKIYGGALKHLEPLLLLILILSSFIEIQDTIRSPLLEHKTMKKATLISVATTTVFYMFCRCFGYAAFGDMAPGNLLTGFGFYNPYSLVDIANSAIVIHLSGAYQVYCQPLFAFVESTAARYFPESKFINNNMEIFIPFEGYKPYKLNMIRLVWRTGFDLAFVTDDDRSLEIEPSIATSPPQKSPVGNDFNVPICAELICGKSSGEGSEPNGSKQTEEAEHKEFGDMGKGKEAATLS
ncbi:amino acid permease 3-like protein [Tanacetum coccineum]|uniref:Amino acid permease 3-like protein n=1 Tax=Tanacetum coccineum TaxID=301880 RepID=A0ABQ5ED93_9ASTR